VKERRARRRKVVFRVRWWGVGGSGLVRIVERDIVLKRRARMMYSQKIVALRREGGDCSW